MPEFLVNVLYCLQWTLDVLDILFKDENIGKEDRKEITITEVDLLDSVVNIEVTSLRICSIFCCSDMPVIWSRPRPRPRHACFIGPAITADVICARSRDNGNLTWLILGKIHLRNCEVRRDPPCDDDLWRHRPLLLSRRNRWCDVRDEFLLPFLKAAPSSALFFCGRLFGT